MRCLRLLVFAATLAAPVLFAMPVAHAEPDLGASVGVAPGPAAVMVPSINPPHYRASLRPGEAFIYRLSVGTIDGARARMSIGLPVTRDGRVLIAVQGEAETTDLVRLVAPVTASYVLTLELGTLLPREVDSKEKGLRDRSFHSVVDGRIVDQDIVSATRSWKTKRTLSREVRDPLSAYFALRALELEPGTELDFDVLDGVALWRTHLKVLEVESIRLNEESPQPPPPVRAIHLEGTLVKIDDLGRLLPKIAKRSISCWLTDDAARILLRARFDADLGRAQLELTTYVSPQGAIKTTKASGKLIPLALPGLTRTAVVTPAKK